MGRKINVRWRETNEQRKKTSERACEEEKNKNISSRPKKKIIALFLHKAGNVSQPICRYVVRVTQRTSRELFRPLCLCVYCHPYLISVPPPSPSPPLLLRHGTGDASVRGVCPGVPAPPPSRHPVGRTLLGRPVLRPLPRPLPRLL